jgi:hypothetical protein
VHEVLLQSAFLGSTICFPILYILLVSVFVYCRHKSAPDAVHSVINYFACISFYKHRDDEAFHCFVTTNKNRCCQWAAAAIFGLNVVVWKAAIL